MDVAVIGVGPATLGADSSGPDAGVGGGGGLPVPARGPAAPHRSVDGAVGVHLASPVVRPLAHGRPLTDCHAGLARVRLRSGSPVLLLTATGDGDTRGGGLGLGLVQGRQAGVAVGNVDVVSPVLRAAVVLGYLGLSRAPRPHLFECFRDGMASLH